MAPSAFGHIPRSFVPECTRRGALLAALGSAVLGAAGRVSGTSAKKNKKNKKTKKKRCRCTPRTLGASCTTNQQCCADKTNRICALKNGAMVVATQCCGALGAACDEDTDCCNEFGCVNGRCFISP